MHKFKNGDSVVLVNNKDDFEEYCDFNGCSPNFVKHFVDGKSAFVHRLRGESLLSFKDEKLGESNWFNEMHFEIFEDEMSQIKRDSQRI